MNILLVCVYFQSSFGWSIEQAFKRQGHRVEIFDYRNPPSPWRSRLSRFWSQSVMPRQLLAAARALAPDLVLICKGETIRAETLQVIRSELHCPVINWFPDARMFGYERVLKQLPHLDGLFSKSPIDVDRMRLLGLRSGHFLPHCADRGLHVEFETSEHDLKPYRCQTAMVGAYYPYREAILQHLTDLDLRIWGPGWKHSNLFRIHPDMVVGRDARSTEQTLVFRGAGVNLNTHHYDDFAELNQRVFDIAGSGGCQILDGNRCAGSIFETPGEIAAFRSSAEMKETVRFLLNNPRIGEEMGRRCRSKVANGHTYDDRVREILDVMKLS
jgi:hypothetical protein